MFDKCLSGKFTDNDISDLLSDVAANKRNATNLSHC